MRKIHAISLIVAVLVVTVLFIAPSHAATKLKLGVVPQQDAVKTLKMFQPLADYLSSQLGVTVEITTSPDIDTFMKRAQQNEFDLIYPNQMCIMQNVISGYEVITVAKQDGSTKFRGILVTRKDSGIKSIADLKGKTAIFADDTSVSGYLLPKAFLLDKGINLNKDLTVKFAGKHDSALLAVYNRAADVAGVREPALKVVQDKIDLNQLQILAATDWVPQLPIAVRKNMDSQTKHKISAALLGLNLNTEPGATVLKALNFDGFVAATDADMEPLRVLAKKLGIN